MTTICRLLHQSLQYDPHEPSSALFVHLEPGAPQASCALMIASSLAGPLKWSVQILNESQLNRRPSLTLQTRHRLAAQLEFEKHKAAREFREK